jgi:hypothetical protein
MRMRQFFKRSRLRRERLAGNECRMILGPGFLYFWMLTIISRPMERRRLPVPEARTADPEQFMAWSRWAELVKTATKPNVGKKMLFEYARPNSLPRGNLGTLPLPVITPKMPGSQAILQQKHIGTICMIYQMTSNKTQIDREFSPSRSLNLTKTARSKCFFEAKKRRDVPKIFLSESL